MGYMYIYKRSNASPFLHLFTAGVFGWSLESCLILLILDIVQLSLVILVGIYVLDTFYVEQVLCFVFVVTQEWGREKK